MPDLNLSLENFRPTFSLLKALDAHNLLADTPIYERMNMLKDAMLYDIGEGPQRPVDILHSLQKQASQIQQLRLCPVIAPGEESRYHIDLTMSYEQALQGAQRVMVLTTAFLGHVRAIHNQLAQVAPTFGIWWQVGAQELFEYVGGTHKLFSEKNLSVLASNAFSYLMGETDLEIAAVIDATTLLLTDLKSRLKLAESTYQLGKDQVNTALADTKIGNVGLIKSTPQTLKNPSPQAGTVATLERAFPGRVISTPDVVEDDDLTLAGEDELTPESETAEILADTDFSERLAVSAEQAKEGRTVGMDEVAERLGLDPAANVTPQPEPPPKPKRASRKKEKPPTPEVPVVTKKVTTDDPFAEVRVTVPAHIENRQEGMSTVTTVTPEIPAAVVGPDPLGLDDGFTPTSPDIPTTEDDFDPTPEPTSPEKVPTTDDDFSLGDADPVAVTPQVTPQVTPSLDDDDDFPIGADASVAVANQTPATKELSEEQPPAVETAPPVNPMAARAYRPNSTSSSAPGKILPQIIDTPLQPIFQPRPGRNHASMVKQGVPPFVLPVKPAAPAATASTSDERII